MQTRAISRSARAGSGTVQSTRLVVTVSNVPSGNASAIASIRTSDTGTFSPAVDCFASLSIPCERSVPVSEVIVPLLTIPRNVAPVPVPISSTLPRSASARAWRIASPISTRSTKPCRASQVGAISS